MSTATEHASSAPARPATDAQPSGFARSRSLAPDVARGLMLLLIAVAHAPAFVGDWGVGWLDRSGEFIRALVAENLARSMFIFLFGYGLGQMLASRTAVGGDWPSVREYCAVAGWSSSSSASCTRPCWCPSTSSVSTGSHC